MALRAISRLAGRRNMCGATIQFAPESVEERRRALHCHLSSAGLTESDILELTSSELFRGSSALRSYTSFVFPRSPAAFQATLKPMNVQQTAQVIAYQADQHAAVVNPLHVVLDNLRSAENVGTIIRSAEAVRCAHVHLCGISPRPPDARVLKTALGAAEYVGHSHSHSTLLTVKKLQEEGVVVWACETTVDAPFHWDCAYPQPLALVFGNEMIGVDVSVIHACDKVVQIPCFGMKNSLNVASAASVVMWEALRQWQE